MNTIKNILTIPSLIFIFLPFVLPIIFKYMKENPNSDITFEYINENVNKKHLWMMQYIRWLFDFTFYYYLIYAL